MAAPVHDALEINMFSGGEWAAELESGERRALEHPLPRACRCILLWQNGNSAADAGCMLAFTLAGPLTC